jgi:pimeloyl-ACP methyl ester carboxylesterase
MTPSNLELQVNLLGLSLAAWKERYPAGVRDGKKTMGGRFISKAQAFDMQSNPASQLNDSDAARLASEIYLYEHPEISRSPEFFFEVLAKRLSYLNYGDDSEISQFAKAYLRDYGVYPELLIDGDGFRAIAFRVGNKKRSILAFPGMVDWPNHPSRNALAVDQLEAHFPTIMAFLQDAVSVAGNKTILLGHGLGGAIAQLVAAWGVDLVDSIYLYSPAPIPTEVAQQFSMKSDYNEEPLVSIYYHTHDNIPHPVGTSILKGYTCVFRSNFNGDSRDSEKLLLLNPNTGVVKVPDVAAKYADRQNY